MTNEQYSNIVGFSISCPKVNLLAAKVLQNKMVEDGWMFQLTSDTDVLDGKLVFIVRAIRDKELTEFGDTEAEAITAVFDRIYGGGK